MAQKKPFRVRDRVTKQLLNIFYPGEDINVNTDGTFRSLITALAELQQQINEAGTGNYTKPPGGIPYIDLAESVRNTLDDVDNKVNIVEGKGLSSNDYTNEDRQKLASLNNYNDSELRQQLTRLQNALDALMNGESVTEAIDTFNEIADFLDGIDTDDPTLANQLLALDNAIKAVESALNNKANSADVYTKSQADSTFVAKEQNKSLMSQDEHNKLTNLPTAAELENNYATKNELTSKQDTLTPGTGISLAQNGTISVDADNTPTPDSPKPVTSGGVSTALQALLSNIHIGQNGNWWTGPETNPANDTGVKAQGPKGNSVADGDTFEIINDLDTGGGGDALSAEMGKVLKTAISKLLDSMGEYCFPLGRPTLSFEGPKCDVTQNLTDVGSDFSALRVDEGAELNITLTPSDNLHVFLTGDVTVEMPLGNDITSTVWNESTGIVHIAAVTDDVVITAKSSTYESGLAFHLDYKNPGDEAGHWIDLVDGVDFKLTDVTETDDGMSFNGTSSKAEVMDDNDPTQPAAPGSKYLDVAYDAGTIEVIAQAESGSLPNANNRGNIPLFINPREKGIFSAFRMGGTSTSYASCVLAVHACVTTADTGDNLAFLYNGSFAGKTVNGGNNIAISANTARTVDGIVRLNGVTKSTLWFDAWLAGPSKIRYTVGYYCFIDNETISERFFNGKIKAIRVYPYKLTEQQMIKNYKVDKKRFNLQ